MSIDEVSFRPMKITLSEAAIDMLYKLKQKGAFRSYSMTIEECIRTIDLISMDMTAMWNTYGDKSFPPSAVMEAFRRYSITMSRFLAHRQGQTKRKE